MKAVKSSEKGRLYKLFIAIYLSIFTLVVGGILATAKLAPELQQVMVAILGLMTLATLDAFRKCLDDVDSGSYIGTYVNELKQTVFRGDVKYYAEGDLTYVGD